MELTTCIHCHTRVVAKVDGLCPSCRSRIGPGEAAETGAKTAALGPEATEPGPAAEPPTQPRSGTRIGPGQVVVVIIVIVVISIFFPHEGRYVNALKRLIGIPTQAELRERERTEEARLKAAADQRKAAEEILEQARHRFEGREKELQEALFAEPGSSAQQDATKALVPRRERRGKVAEELPPPPAIRPSGGARSNDPPAANPPGG